jgi:hypothetical protein
MPLVIGAGTSKPHIDARLIGNWPAPATRRPGLLAIPRLLGAHTV